MKTLIISTLAILALLGFSGCSRITPSTASTLAQFYDTTRTIIHKGEEIVIINGDLLPEETLKKLEEMDDALTVPKELERIQKTMEVIQR